MAIEIIEHASGCIHRGCTFEITGVATISASSTLKLLGVIDGRDVALHNYVIRGDRGPFTVELLEAPTVTAVGTPLQQQNRNRNVANNTSTVSVYSGPTTSGGTVIYTARVPDVGAGSHVQGGEDAMPYEWVLKRNESYVFQITNNDASNDLNISFEMLWCEGL